MRTTIGEDERRSGGPSGREGAAGHGRIDLGPRVATLVPGMTPGSPSRNLFLGAAYLGTLAVLSAIAATVATSYRPYRGC